MIAPLKKLLDIAETALAETDRSMFLSAIEDSFDEMWLCCKSLEGSNIFQLLTDIWSFPGAHEEILEDLNSSMNRWMLAVQGSVVLGWVDKKTDANAFVTTWWSTWWGQAAFKQSTVLAPTVESIRKLLLGAIGVEVQ